MTTTILIKVATNNNIIEVVANTFTAMGVEHNIVAGMEARNIIAMEQLATQEG